MGTLGTGDIGDGWVASSQGLVSRDHTPSEKLEGSGILPVPFSFFSPESGGNT